MMPKHSCNIHFVRIHEKETTSNIRLKMVWRWRPTDCCGVVVEVAMVDLATKSPRGCWDRKRMMIFKLSFKTAHLFLYMHVGIDHVCVWDCVSNAVVTIRRQTVFITSKTDALDQVKYHTAQHQINHTATFLDSWVNSIFCCKLSSSFNSLKNCFSKSHWKTL